MTVTDEFRLLPLMVRDAADGDTEAAGRIARHAGEMADALHHHHQAEDELLCPQLLKRTPVDTRLVERMEAQHHRRDPPPRGRGAAAVAARGPPPRQGRPSG